jgi:hypothetical protein
MACHLRQPPSKRSVKPLPWKPNHLMLMQTKLGNKRIQTDLHELHPTPHFPKQLHYITPTTKNSHWQSMSGLPWTYLIRRLFTDTSVPALFPHLWPSHIGFVALLRLLPHHSTTSKQHSQPLSHSSSGAGTRQPISLGAFTGYSVVTWYRDTLLPFPSQRCTLCRVPGHTTNQSSKHPLAPMRCKCYNQEVAATLRATCPKATG